MGDDGTVAEQWGSVRHVGSGRSMVQDCGVRSGMRDNWSVVGVVTEDGRCRCDRLDNVSDRGRLGDNRVETVNRVGRVVNGASAAIGLNQRVLLAKMTNCVVSRILRL